ncbi:hypothetical protein [Nitratiruptor sp. SB155-2]|uniref:hypothetical protein n=1 Tax=Nitratiruptor sp. (strain SB155-2) TaxID=387092 RepID=UPI0001586F24|nr:hypothetical protein [Nitratiruptor sp. SB155-2]BAF69555.1 hypothetical protein NIS_0441 [Nitratiruptor sp. SB155-2]BAN05312.1 hypothetical protein [Nitratiruptor phage NrS-1]
MIKKYDDNYIDLSRIDAVTKMYKSQFNNVQYWSFVVILNGKKIEFEDYDEERIQILRDKIVNDWIRITNANA